MGDQTGTLCSERLILRRWRSSDLAPFAALNADPEVMAFFASPLSRDESDALVDRIERHFDEHGFGFWAVEAVGTGTFVGFVGLAHPRFEAHFTPCVEIGWRLAREHWGRGYATEAAGAALDHAFGALAIPEVVAFAVQGNTRSRAVMRRLGMHHDSRDDFDHPLIGEGDVLRRHVLYRITATEWIRRKGST